MHDELAITRDHYQAAITDPAALLARITSVRIRLVMGICEAA